MCTVAHVLGACTYSLKQKRFNYCHDSILQKLVEHIKKFFETYKVVKQARPSLRLSFERAGEIRTRKKVGAKGILCMTDDWTMVSDLNQDNCFPPFISPPTFRPDLVLYSKKLKCVIMIETTSPCEENSLYWNKRKRCRYAALKKACEANGWSSFLFAVEVCARGYCANSLAARQLSFSTKQVKALSRDCSSVALKTSFAIWFARASFFWDVAPVSSKTSLSSIQIGKRPAMDSLDVQERRARESPVAVGYSKGRKGHLTTYLRNL